MPLYATPKPEQQQNWVVQGALLLIIIVGAWLRLIAVHHSLWLDELATSWVVNGSVQDIWEKSLYNNTSPFYFYLEFFSVKIFGFTEFGLRFPSLLAGVLFIPLVFLITRRLTNSQIAALFAALFIALDSKMVYYSIEVRSYAITMLWVVLCMFQVITAIRNTINKKNSIGIGITLGLIIWSHYLAGIFVICVIVILLAHIFRQHQTKQNKVSLIISLLLPFLIMLLPLLNQLKYIYANRTLFSSYIPKPQLQDVTEIMPQVITYFGISFLVYLAVRQFTKRHEQPVESNKWSWLLIICWLIPVLFTFILSISGVLQIFISRYISWYLPLIILSAVFFTNAISIQYLRYAVFIFLFIYTQLIHTTAVIPKIFQSDNKEQFIAMLTPEQGTNDWKETVHVVNTMAKQPEHVYVKSGLIEAKAIGEGKVISPLMAEYLLSSVNALYSLRPDLLEKAVPVYDVKAIPESESNYWFIGKLMEWDAAIIAAKAQKFTLPDCYIQIYYVP